MTEPWTPTASEVTDITGETVTDANITTAQAIIETVCGYDLSDVRRATLYRRDLRMLRKAVVWESAFVSANPGLFVTEGNLTQASANGVSKTWGAGGSGAALLSPLAQMALDRLSWRRSKSIHLGRDRSQVRPSRAQTLISDGPSSDWRPIR